jgi:4-hydroxybenzoate polyprenyltransferase
MAKWCALRAVHPFPSIVVAAITGALAVAVDDERSLATGLVLAVAMLGIQFTIGLVNDVVDAADDAATKPWKPIPRGCLTRRTASLAAVACSIAGLALAAGFGLWSLLLAAGCLSCGLVYDLWLKRTLLSWLPLSIALPLMVAWVLAATDEWEPGDAWLLVLGPILGLAIHLANQAPDIEADRTRGVRGLAHRLGPAWSLAVAYGLGTGLVIAGAVILVGVADGVTALAVGVSLAGVLAVGAMASARGVTVVAFPALIAVGGTLAIALLAALHG